MMVTHVRCAGRSPRATGSDLGLTYPAHRPVTAAGAREDRPTGLGLIAGTITPATPQMVDGLLAGAGPVRLVIASNGGDIASALEVCRLLRTHRARTTAIVHAAESAASLIAVAATETVIAPSGWFHVHRARERPQRGRTPGAVDLITDINVQIAHAMAASTGQTPGFWARAMVAEHRFIGAAAVDVGLADRVELTSDNRSVSTPTMRGNQA